MSGTIVTFYSYKGGAGRTMALANVGCLLAAAGYRVLVIDWDLEAPGLHRYLHPFLDDPELASSEGLIDLVWSYAAAAARGRANDNVELTPLSLADPEHVVIATHFLADEKGKRGCLHFIPAGAQTIVYADRVRTFDWSAMFSRLDGAEFVRRFGGRCRTLYDFTLIDSRTGIADIAGVATIMLPDMVVLCFTANRQSVLGARAIGDSIREARPGLRILPLITRIEKGVEGWREAQDFYRKELGHLLPQYIDDKARITYWGTAEVVHYPNYALVETLAVFGDAPEEQTSLLSDMRRRATRITEGEFMEAADILQAPVFSEDTRRNYFRRIRFRVPRIAALREAMEGDPATAVDLLCSWCPELSFESPADLELAQELASSLDELAVRLSQSGNNSGAMAAIQSSTEVKRRLVARSPERFMADLATSLNNLSNLLSDGGDRLGALSAIREAVELRRRLIQDDPERVAPDLATSLNNLSNRLAVVGDSAAALARIREAVEIRRQLAQGNPARFAPDLASSLNSLSNLLSEAGDGAGALLAIREAVDTYRRLAQQNPGRFAPDLALSLSNLSNRLTIGGDRTGALAAISESVQIYRGLTQESPARFAPDLASGLHNLSTGLSDAGDDAPALAAIREAVEIYRRLAQENPGRFAPDLAGSLHNLSNCLSAARDTAGALLAAREAADIRRQLAQDNPARYLPDLERSLNDLSLRLRDAGEGKSTQSAVSYTETLGIHLPKLPELDQDDVKAVRSFLPGKLLGRTAALLSLALLVAGLVDQGLKRLLAFDLLPTPWLHFGLFGLPLLAVASQLLVEWRAEQGRRALQRLAVRVGAEQSGYFRIGPYLDTAEDRARFDRADRAHEKVLGWIERSGGVPLYLTGDAGSGKSSLLNAFVLPELRDRGWTVIEARAWQDPETAVRAALAQLPGARRPREGEKPALRGLIEAAAQRADVGLLLVLDQFEEFVILGKPEQHRGFAGLLADLRATPVGGFSLLLVVRSDYQTFLDVMGLPPLRYGENFYQVGRFTIAAATGFMRRSGLELQPAAVDRLLTSTAELDETPGLVRPITLNVIGYVLAAGKTVAPSLDAGQLVRRYIELTVAQPAVRDFAPQVLEQLVTEQGTKRPQSEQEIATSTQLRRGEVRAVLNSLGAAGLARPLDPIQGVWELSADFIARSVARYLGRWRNRRLKRSALYIAPALLTVIMLVSIGVIVWNRLSSYQARSELAEFGLTITATAGGLAAEANSHLTSESFTLASRSLAKLPALQSLDLRRTGIENLDPLEGLTALLLLDLAGTKVENLEPLKGLTALQSLDLSGTKVANVEPLKGLTALQSLNLSGTTVANLEPLKGLTALQSLDLNGTKVANLEPLKGLTALQSLNLSDTKVGNLEPLKGLTALQSLDLSGTTVANLEPLKGLTAAQSLDLSRTKVENLEPLKGLTGLQTLALSGAPVAHLEPLEDLPALQRLSFSGTVPEAELTRLIHYRQEKNLPPVKIVPLANR